MSRRRHNPEDLDGSFVPLVIFLGASVACPLFLYLLAKAWPLAVLLAVVVLVKFPDHFGQ